MTRAPGLSCADAADRLCAILAPVLPADWAAIRHHPEGRRLHGMDQLGRQIVVHALSERFGFTLREVGAALGVHWTSARDQAAAFDTLPPTARDAAETVALAAYELALAAAIVAPKPKLPA